MVVITLFIMWDMGEFSACKFLRLVLPNLSDIVEDSYLVGCIDTTCFAIHVIARNLGGATGVMVMQLVPDFSTSLGQWPGLTPLLNFFS
jgi:hypothetical protein